MGFALRASLGCSNLIRSNLSGLPAQHKFIPDEFVFVRTKNVTQKMHPGRSCFALRSLDGVKRNPGIFCGFEQPRITEYIHVFCPSGQPSAVQIRSNRI